MNQSQNTEKPALTGFNRALRRRLAAFRRNHRGAAAVEFAIVVPVLVAMYFGMVELSLALGHDAKAQRLAGILSDMVTQSIAITNTDMQTMFKASAAVMQPYEVNKLTMRVTSYLIDRNGNAFVDWSDAKNIGAPLPYDPLPRCLPANALVSNSLRIVRPGSVVISEVKVTHIPTVGTIIAPDGVTMKAQQPTRPRITTSVGREGIPAANCPGFAA